MARSRWVLDLGGPLALSAGAAELAARLLAPRAALPDPAPVDVADHFSPAEIARGRRYARGQLAVGLAGSALEGAVLAAITARAARRGAGGASGAPAGAAAGAALSAGLALAGLPTAAVARRRSLAVGLSTQSWRDWFADLGKATAIQSALAAAGGGALLETMRRWPRGWWLPAAGGSWLAGTVLAALAPVVLDPVFNDFTPLPDGETRTDVLELARAAGVSVGEVYAVDASRRTTAANAYVSGLGPTKRVVLFDTLLDAYARDEVRGVVAHELAHVRNRDVLRSVAFLALTAPAAALAVQRIGWWLSPARATAAALPAVALAVAIVSLPAGFSARRLSRMVERRADALSLELSQAPEAFVSFERRIALQNLADVQPPRLVSLLSTHPPTAERIGLALAYLRDRDGGPQTRAGASPPPK